MINWKKYNKGEKPFEPWFIEMMEKNDREWQVYFEDWKRRVSKNYVCKYCKSK